MKKIIFAFLLTLSTNSFAADEIGFVTGNTFQATPIRAEISVTCSDPSTGRTDFGHFICRDTVLDPAEFVSFQGPKGIDANQISLKAIRANGGWLEKIAGYNSEKGKSTSTFNLWINTLTQKGLLRFGNNQVIYSFRKDGKEVLGGELNALVEDGEPRSCRYREHFYSNSMSDCVVGNSMHCSSAFSRQNWCK